MTPPRPFAMTAADSAWLRMEQPENPMTITGIMGFGERIEMEAVRAWLESRIVPYPRFRMKVDGLGTGSPRWVPDPDFSLDHVVVPARLPSPGKAGLERLVSELMSTPMSFSHSPWTVHYVPEVDHGDGTSGTALVVRLHHVIGDGIALMHVLLNSADEFERHVPAPRTPRKPTSARVARTLKGAAAETKDLLTHPSHALDRVKTLGKGIGALGGLLAMRPDSHTVFKGQASVDKRAAWTRPYALDRLKAIGRGMGAKLNDVLLATAAGALRRYLVDESQPVRDVEVRAAVPFNVRPLERAHELGNSFGLVFLSLPVALPTPQARLAELKRRMDAAKDSAEPMVVYGILQSIGRAPKWAHRMVVKMFAEKTSAVMTNVPGPQRTLHIGGAPLTTLMFWVPQAGDIGLGLSLLSYAGRVRVGVGSDAAYVERPERLVAAFEAELDALEAEFGGQEVHPE